MRRWKDALTGLAFAGCLAVSALALGLVARTQTGSPPVVDRAALLAWLRDNTSPDDPLSRKRALREQFQRETAAGFDWNSELATWSPDERRRGAANYRRLVDAWLSDIINGYFAVTEPDRSEFLHTQLAAAATWPRLDEAGGRTSNARVGRGVRADLLVAAGERAAQARGRERRKLKQFLQACQGEIVPPVLRKLLPVE